MKKIVLISNIPFTIFNFRKELVEELVKRDYSVVAVCNTNSNLNNFENNPNVKVVHWELNRRSINPLGELKSLYVLYRILKSEKPDVFFAYTIKPVIYSGLCNVFLKIEKSNSFITGLGYVFINQSFKNIILRRLIVFLYRFSLMKVQKVFFQNTDDINLFNKLRILPKSKTYLTNGSGVNLDYYKNLSGINKEPFSFVVISRLLKDKGIYEYIEAIKIVKKQFPHSRFYLAGPFDVNPSSIKKSEVDKWEEEGLVHYLGDLKDVREVLSRVEVSILPSYREGTPRIILESMSMGLPIIVTDAPGCRETVIHKYNGFLVDVKNVQSLAEAMSEFVKNPHLISQMGSNSILFAKEKYDVRKVIHSILEETL